MHCLTEVAIYSCITSSAAVASHQTENGAKTHTPHWQQSYVHPEGPALSRCCRITAVEPIGTTQDWKCSPSLPLRPRGYVARTSAAPPPQAGTHNCPYICYKMASRKTRGLIYKDGSGVFQASLQWGGWRLRGRLWADVSLMNSPQNYAKRNVNDIFISNWWKKNSLEFRRENFSHSNKTREMFWTYISTVSCC